jgi:hypothetical protein
VQDQINIPYSSVEILEDLVIPTPSQDDAISTPETPILPEISNLDDTI